MSKTMTMMEPVPPGEMVKEDFLTRSGKTQHRLAQAIGAPARGINEIVHGTRRISADTALHLSRFPGMSDGFWMNIQGHYDIEVEKYRLRATLAPIEPLETPVDCCECSVRISSRRGFPTTTRPRVGQALSRAAMSRASNSSP